MKRTLSILGQVITALLLIFSVGMLIFAIVSVKTVGQQGTVFGYRTYIVNSDSMKDTFEAGDLVVSKTVDPETLKEGDIITFRSIDPESWGEVFTHKIRAITTYEGQPAFVTYGTTNDVDDSYPAPFDNVMGEYVLAIPNLGHAFQFFKTPAGYVAVVLVPFLILILIQLVHFIKLVKEYRAEKQEEAQRQDDNVQAKLREAEQMKEELERLRAQLGETTTEQESEETVAK